MTAAPDDPLRSGPRRAARDDVGRLPARRRREPPAHPTVAAAVLMIVVVVLVVVVSALGVLGR